MAFSMVIGSPPPNFGRLAIINRELQRLFAEKKCYRENMRKIAFRMQAMRPH